MLPNDAAGQQENGDIPTADQEQQGDGGEEERQGAPKLLDEVVIESDEAELEAALGKVGWRLLGELVDQRPKGSGARLVSNAGLEANSDIEFARAVLSHFKRQIDVS